MAEKKRETVGKHSVDLAQKTPDTRDPIELERAAHKDYVANVHECIERGKKDFNSDFFVTVLVKKERLMQNVIRNYYFARSTCPTPDYDQTVYHYKKEDDDIHFLWVVPSKDTCEMFRDNAPMVDPMEWELLENVLSFYDNSLMKKSKILNGEKLLSSELEDAKIYTS